MPANSDKPNLWKEDIARSVDLYNQWFLRFAPDAFRRSRIHATGQVEVAFAHTANLTLLTPDVLRSHPEVLPILRMATCPPIARDRLIGLSGAPAQLVKSMELKARVPPRGPRATIQAGLASICDTMNALLDPDIVVWRDRVEMASSAELLRAATIIADRHCGAMADPIIRNAQEQRQLAEIGNWLETNHYRQIEPREIGTLQDMPLGTFTFRLNVPVRLADVQRREVNIPIDAVIQPRHFAPGALPLLVEAKSAGDFTNVNKRRKEEATKMAQLKANYGAETRFVLFLCGYFDSGYLGYEAAEGIDWVWEHRISDFGDLGL
jgi:hypothetical protein